jgi:hypothetical protein
MGRKMQETNSCAMNQQCSGMGRAVGAGAGVIQTGKRWEISEGGLRRRKFNLRPSAEAPLRLQRAAENKITPIHFAA